MAIVSLKKVTLVGPSAQQESVLEGLQGLACMHLVDIGQVVEGRVLDHPRRNQMHAALRYLQGCPVHRPAATHTTDYEPHRITDEVLANRDRRRELREEREELLRAIEQTQPWGEFRIKDAEAIAGQSLWFYRLRHRQVSGIPSGVVRHVASRDREFTYVVVVAPEPPRGMPSAPLELDPRPLSELRDRLVEIDETADALEVERIALTRWITHLKSDLEQADRETERMTASDLMLQDDDLFAVQGWLAGTTLPELKRFAQQHHLALLVAEPDPLEEPPTLLSNPRPVVGAEGAVTFFMTPNYRAWDPTWVMYISFSFFFAMIMADAGYGIVLGVILAACHKRLGATENLRRFRYLAVFMVAVTILYGMLIGSYFGISPPEGSLLDRIVIKTGGQSIMSDRDAMMFLSASIGVFHLGLANLVVAWQRRGRSQALSSVGWAVALLGGWLMAMAKLPRPEIVPYLASRLDRQTEAFGEALWTTGTVALAAGLIAVLLFSSARPFFSARISDWLWRPLDGLMGLTNVTKAFGDALSYLRLFALGLASAQLALIFNQLASDASQIRGVGLFLGLMIFLLGHTLNLVLAIVGGVVHGLRLNCIEFFSWSLNEEGQPFRAFGKKADS